MSTGDVYGRLCGKNGEFWVTLGLVIRTVGTDVLT